MTKPDKAPTIAARTVLILLTLGGCATPTPVGDPASIEVLAPPSVHGLQDVTLEAVASGPAMSEFTWHQIAGPEVLLDAAGATAEFQAPDVEETAGLAFRVRGGNGGVVLARADVEIDVLPTIFYEKVPFAIDPTIDPEGILLAHDFNGNGLSDVMVFQFYFDQPIRGPIRVLKNTGGNFVDATEEFFVGEPPSFYQPRRIEVADFNGNGHMDIFIAAHGVDSTSAGEPNGLMLSTSDGRLMDASDELPAESAYSHGSCIGDIDGDGDIDIMVSNLGSDAFIAVNYLLINDGSGTFEADTNRLPARLLEYYAGDCLLVDIDGDGALDIVVGHHGQGFAPAWFKNDGTGDFSLSDEHTLPTLELEGETAMTVLIESMDVNGNGANDLIFSLVSMNYRGAALHVLINDGAGNFTAAPLDTFPFSYHATDDGVRKFWIKSLQIMDWNRNGLDDVVMTWRDYSGEDPALASVLPVLWLNNGDGTFRPVFSDIMPLDEFDGGRHWNGGVVIDLDGDGRHDMMSIGWRYQLFKEIVPYPR